MEDYKTEKEFFYHKQNYADYSQFEGVEVIELLAKFKQHLIDTGEMVQADRWINVSDKLPNNRTYVVVHWTCGYDIAEYKHGCFFTGLDKIAGVTHWQKITDPTNPNTKS